MRAFLLLILVMSVIFNLLFSAGFVRARSEAKRLQLERETGGAGSAAAPVPVSPNGPDANQGSGRRGPDGRHGDGPSRRPDGARMFPRELELDPAQKEVFEQLRQSMREEEAVLDETMAGVRKQLADEVQNDEPNVDRLRELIARQGDLMQQRRVGAANRFADFLNVLSPEQTRIMAKHMLRNMPGRGHGSGDGGRDGGRPRDGSPGKMPPELMKRLDVDGDGILNDTERMAAQAEFEKHRRDWEARRAELRARFDADKNGELDHDEAAQMRQWLLENRSRQGGEGRGRDGERGADGHGTPGAPGAPGNFDGDDPRHDGPDPMRPPPNREDGPGGIGEEAFVPDGW